EPAEIHVRVGDRLGQFVRGDGRQLVDGRRAQAGVADRAARVGDDGIPHRLPARPGEGAVVAEDALPRRALAGPEVHGDVRLDVDDIEPVRVDRLETAAGDIRRERGLDGGVADGRAERARG